MSQLWRLLIVTAATHVFACGLGLVRTQGADLFFVWMSVVSLVVLVVGYDTRSSEPSPYLRMAALLAVTVFAWYFTALRLGVDRKDWGTTGDSFGGTSSILSALAFLAATAAYELQQRNANEQREASSDASTGEMLKLFLKFEEDHLRQIRNSAWNARVEWYTVNEADRPRMLERLFASSVPESFDQAFETDHMKSGSMDVFRLLNFYTALSHLPCPDEKLRSAGFYFGYWRGFLFDFVAEYEERFLRLSEERRKMLGKQDWKQSLEKLGERLGLPRYNPEADVFHPQGWR